MEITIGLLSLAVTIVGLIFTRTDRLLKEMRDLEREMTELLREIRDNLK